jgi:hypothetical protein
MDHANLAEALLREGKYRAAWSACDMGLATAPNNAALYVCLGRALDGLERPEEAIAACDAALRLEPAGATASAAWGVKAQIFTSLDEGQKALDAATRSLELAPQRVNALTLMGDVLSWNGDLRTALPFIEWNWVDEQRRCHERLGALPVWTGDDLRGRRLLVTHEQGYGDAIQMARYLPFLRARASRLALECAPASLELLRHAPGVDDVLALYAPVNIENYDAYVRMMLLPRMLGVGPEVIGTTPYLQADPQRITTWRARLGVDGDLRVGIAWAGNARHVFDFRRSMPLELLSPLSDVRGVRWFSLVTGERADESVPGWNVEPIGCDFADLADAAAVIAQLDLVITVDTAAAHLAGALGRPVWTMLPRRPDWRWAGNGDATPWYPTMRLFRETRADWSTVVANVRAALERLTQG